MKRFEAKIYLPRKGQGVKFKSLTEAIDTETPTGRAMWQMVEILAELERSLIQERTKAGRAAAQARGVKMGLTDRATGHPCAQAERTGRKPQGHSTIAQCVAADALQGAEKVLGSTKVKTLANGTKAVLYNSTSGGTSIALQDAAGRTVTKIRY